MVPPYQVFISYSTKDLPTVQYVQQLLLSVPRRASNGAAEVEVFVAEYGVAPGAPLAESILDAIAACDIFILFWSRSSGESEWVPQEIGVARGLGKPILPVVLESGLKLPGFINDLKYLRAHGQETDWAARLHDMVTDAAHDQFVAQQEAMFQEQQKRAIALLIFGGLGLYALSQRG